MTSYEEQVTGDVSKDRQLSEEKIAAEGKMFEAFDLVSRAAGYASEDHLEGFAQLQTGAALLETLVSPLAPEDRFNAYAMIATEAEAFQDALDPKLSLLERTGMEELSMYRELSSLMGQAMDMQDRYTDLARQAMLH